MMNLNWQYKKIGDVCTVERGGSPRPIEKYITTDESGINWIKIGDTSDSMYITSTAQKIIPEGMKKSRYVEPGDFLLSNSMSFGRPYILKIDGCIHDGWLVLRDTHNLFDKRFLYYYLSSPTTFQKFKMLAVGGVVNNLNSSMVRGVEIPIPSKKEQEKIANILDEVVLLINKRKQQLSKLDELVKARFVELFGHQGSNEKNMPYGKIDDVAEIYLGLTHTPTYVSEGVKFISAKNTSCDYLDLLDVKYISREEFEGAPIGAKPQKGDVLFSRVGSNLGHPVILNIDDELCTFVSLGFLRTKGIVTNLYLKHWMRDDFFAEQVRRKVVGGGQPNLNTGWLKEFRIVIPPMDLQEQFATFVEQTDKSKLEIQQSLEKLETLKKSLMQQYFG